MLLGYDIRSNMLWLTRGMKPRAVYLGTDRTASHCHRENLLMSAGSWVSVEGVAKDLGVAKDWVYRWVEHKALPTHKVDCLWQFKPSEVDPWVRVAGAASEGPENRGGEVQG